MNWVFAAAMFFVFAAMAGCFPGVTGRVDVRADVRADSKDFVGALASPSATASPPTTVGGSVSSGISDEDLAKIGKVVKESASTSPPASQVSPSWKELTGTFRFTGNVNGKESKLLGGAYSYVLQKPVFWLKTEKGEQQGAYTLENASPSLAAGMFATLSIDIKDGGEFNQGTFFEMLNGTKSIVAGFSPEMGLVEFRNEFAPVGIVNVPEWWFREHAIKSAEDVSGLLIVGGKWVMMMYPNLNPAIIKPVADPDAGWLPTDDVMSFGSGVTYAFYSLSDGHVFFFTKRGDAFALQEKTISPR